VPTQPPERGPHLDGHPAQLHDLPRKTTHPSEIRGGVDGGDDCLHVLLPRRAQGRQRTRLVLARGSESGDRGSVFSHPSAQRVVTFEHGTRGVFERDRDQRAQVRRPVGERDELLLKRRRRGGRKPARPGAGISSSGPELSDPRALLVGESGAPRTRRRRRSPMAGETLVTVVGNLTTDPELRFTPSGAAVANFTVASTPRTFDRESGAWRDGEAMFLRCSLWRQYAENVAESLGRGARVVVQGRLRQRSYDTKEGEKRTVTELDVDEIGPALRYATAKVTRLSRAASGEASSSWTPEPEAAVSPPF
jgi:single-strand DNA-binding protein